MRSIRKSEWKSFTDRVTKGLVGTQAEIEVASLKLGAQIEAEWVPLLGIAYDPKDDLFEVATESIDHLVPRPQELYAEEKAYGLELLALVDADGDRHLIRFRGPLMLPPPHA
jgi:Family of unknown function (DUF5335)